MRHLIGIVLAVCAVCVGGELRKNIIYDASGVSVHAGRIRTDGSVNYSCDFSEMEPGWKIHNYENRLQIETRLFHGRQALVVSNAGKKRCDNAFRIQFSPLPVEKNLFYTVVFSALSSFYKPDGIEKLYVSHAAFYDQNRKLLEKQPLVGGIEQDGRYHQYVYQGRIPPEAAFFELCLGGDNPDFRPGQYLAYSGLKIRLSGRTDGGGEGEFFSGILPVRNKAAAGGKKMMLSWKCSGNQAGARFQIAVADKQEKLWKKQAEFFGPDGTAGTWFTQAEGTDIAGYLKNAEWIRCRGRLAAGLKETAVLEKICIAGNSISGWTEQVDYAAPVLTRISESPTTDGSRPFILRVEDDSEIDWTSLKVLLDGTEVTGRVRRTANEISIPPLEKFADGIHEVRIDLADLHGNAAAGLPLFFRIGSRMSHPQASLRDDGAVLIDGKPFFPLGIYSVAKHEFNQRNFDLAFRELRQCGINLVQTYQVRRNANFYDFMEKARANGMKIWVAGRKSSNDYDLGRIAACLKEDLANPALLAWYVGDDTILHNSVRQIQDRTRMVKALAPHLLTTQADNPRIYPDPDKGGPHTVYQTRYEAYADATLCFMPELYPLKKGNQEESEKCAAYILLNMEAILNGVKARKLPPRSIWPIIQYFKGWRQWKRFPTSRELRAMSFAAVIGGARGLVWYTYNSSSDGQGVAYSRENWDVFRTVCRELADLLPVLTERDAPVQLRPRVLSGPLCNDYHRPSVASLTKVHQGRTYLLAVNSAAEKVQIALPPGDFRNWRRLQGAEDSPKSMEKDGLKMELAPLEVLVCELW